MISIIVYIKVKYVMYGLIVNLLIMNILQNTISTVSIKKTVQNFKIK